MSEAETAYIAKCLCGCGAITFATVDRPVWAKENAKTIAKKIREGYIVEHVALPVPIEPCRAQRK